MNELAYTNTSLSNSLGQLADYVGLDLNSQELIEVFDALKVAESVVEDLHKNIRAKLIKKIEEEGTKITDKGSMMLEVGGYSIEARPHKTGFDPKKVEGLLRAKGVGAGISVYMDEKVTYVVNEMKLREVLKIMSQDELETCRFPLNYALQTPKKVKTVDE